MTVPPSTKDADLQVCLSPVLITTGGTVTFMLELPTPIDLRSVVSVGVTDLQGGPCPVVQFDNSSRLLQGGWVCE